MSGMIDTPDKETCVLYNAECPVCSYEIDHYAAYTAREDLPIRFDDLNNAAALSSWDIDPNRAARRLHVLKNGELLQGIPAFIALWEEMPRYRKLATFVRLPGVFHLACAMYDHVLAPVIYWTHLRRLRRAAG